MTQTIGSKIPSIRHLLYFVAVAEEENFHRAARRLNLAQPALSRRIIELESDLEITLFERRPQGIKLTSAGRVMLSEGRKIIDRYVDLCDTAKHIHDGVSGYLKIGYNEGTVNVREVAVPLIAFKDRYAQVELQYFPTHDKLDLKLLQGDLDVAFIYTVAGDRHKFRSAKLLSDTFSLILPIGHPLASAPRLELTQVANEPVVWPSRTTFPSIHKVMLEQYSGIDHAPRIVAEAFGVNQIINLVSRGLGIGWVPRRQSGSLPENLVLRDVEGFSVTTSLELAWMPSKQSPLIPELVSSLALLPCEITA